MTRSLPFQAALLTTAAFGALCAGAGTARATTYLQTDLVSDIPGLAEVTDSNLVNSWGLSHLTGSPFWVSNQGTGTASLYSVTGATATPANLFPPTPPGSNFITVPPPVSAGFPGPTGQVANSAMKSFDIGTTGPAFFIFANLNGSISAWNLSNVPKGNESTVVATATTPGSSYTGLAVNSAGNLLYAANGTTGAIDVYNSSFAHTTVTGSFVDPDLPAGYVPFNVEDIGGKVYVTYALAGHGPQTTATAGEGAVAVFDESGHFMKQLVGVSTSGELASPWGMAIAPSDFGKFSGDLLVGNFSYKDSEINAFNPTSGMFEGMIPIDDGSGNTPGGLWTLTFGGGPKDGSPNILYFTDGLDGETKGLFGAMTAVPEPSTWAMMLVGFGGLALFAARRRRAALAIS